MSAIVISARPGSGSGDLLSSNNLGDVASASTSRTNLGVGTGDSPQFAGINLGHASDTTFTRSSAGVAAIEGKVIFTAGTKIDTLQAAYYAEDSGSTDAYAATYAPAPTGYVKGTVYRVLCATANTGACTLNLNALGAKSIKLWQDTGAFDPPDGEISAGQIVEFCYNGTDMIIISRSAIQGGSGGGDVSGPGSSTDNNVPRWNGTGGDTLQSSTLTISDAGDGSFLKSLTLGNITAFEGTLKFQDVANAVVGTLQKASIASARTWTLPDATGTLVTAASAFGTDNVLLKSDGTGTGAQATGIGVDDSNNMTGIAELNATTANVSGGINLGENVGIRFTPSLSADGKWCGYSETGTAGTALAFGNLCYFAVADSRWELADADAAATAGDVKLGFCVLAAAADGDPTEMLFYGKIRADSAFPTFTVGAPVYAGTTAGDVQVAQPSGTDDVIRRVGIARTADELWVDIEPSYITHT